MHGLALLFFVFCLKYSSLNFKRLPTWPKKVKAKNVMRPHILLRLTFPKLVNAAICIKTLLVKIH